MVTKPGPTAPIARSAMVGLCGRMACTFFPGRTNSGGAGLCLSPAVLAHTAGSVRTWQAQTWPRALGPTKEACHCLASSISGKTMQGHVTV